MRTGEVRDRMIGVQKMSSPVSQGTSVQPGHPVTRGLRGAVPP